MSGLLSVWHFLFLFLFSFLFFWVNPNAYWIPYMHCSWDKLCQEVLCSRRGTVNVEQHAVLAGSLCCAAQWEWEFVMLLLCLRLHLRVQRQPPVLWWEGCPLVRACQEDPCRPAFSRSVHRYANWLFFFFLISATNYPNCHKWTSAGWTQMNWWIDDIPSCTRTLTTAV